MKLTKDDQRAINYIATGLGIVPVRKRFWKQYEKGVLTPNSARVELEEVPSYRISIPVWGNAAPQMIELPETPETTRVKIEMFFNLP